MSGGGGGGAKTVGDDGMQLILNLKRNPDIIPPYQTDLVKRCVDQINALYQANGKDLLEIRSGVCVMEDDLVLLMRARQATIERLKRCCLVYLNERLTRLRAMRWKIGGMLPLSVKANLSESELKWFNDYCKALTDFQSGLGDSGVNLMVNMKPPKSLFVQVRVVQEYGEFETADGTVVHLKQNTLHSLPRQDCELLIKQGILEFC